MIAVAFAVLALLIGNIGRSNRLDFIDTPRSCCESLELKLLVWL